jgi:hypothetical protein
MQRKTIYLVACGVTGAVLYNRTHRAELKEYCIVKNDKVYRGPCIAFQFPCQKVWTVREFWFELNTDNYIGDGSPRVGIRNDVVVGPDCDNSTSLAKIAGHDKQELYNLIEKSIITHSRARWEHGYHHENFNTEEYERRINDDLAKIGMVVVHYRNCRYERDIYRI